MLEIAGGILIAYGVVQVVAFIIAALMEDV